MVRITPLFLFPPLPATDGDGFAEVQVERVAYDIGADKFQRGVDLDSEMAAERGGIDTPVERIRDHRKRIGEARACRFDGDHVALAAKAEMNRFGATKLDVHIAV